VFNNASAIGTLEFMDKMTKLNQTDIVAFKYNTKNIEFGNPIIDEKKLEKFLTMNSFGNIYNETVEIPKPTNPPNNKTGKNYGGKETRRKTQKLNR
jgi:hypothetical protein